MRENLKVHGALLIVQVMFSFNTILVRWALQYVENIVMIGMRQTIATVVLAIIAQSHTESRNFQVTTRLKYLFALMGLCGVVCHLYFNSMGIHLTNAVTATIFSTSRPVFATFISIAAGIDRFSFYKTMGIIIAVTGDCMVMQVWNLSLVGHSYVLGCICLFISNFCYASYLVMLKIAVKEAPLPHILSRVFAFGCTGIIAIAWIRQEAFEALATAPTNVMIIAIWGGLVVSPVPYLLNGFSMSRVPPSTVALYCNLEAPLGAIFAFTILSERPSGWHFVGSIVVMCGVFTGVCGDQYHHRVVQIFSSLFGYTTNKKEDEEDGIEGQKTPTHASVALLPDGETPTPHGNYAAFPGGSSSSMNYTGGAASIPVGTSSVDVSVHSKAVVGELAQRRGNPPESPLIVDTPSPFIRP